MAACASECYKFAVVQESAGRTTFLVLWIRRNKGRWHHTLIKRCTGMVTRSMSCMGLDGVTHVGFFLDKQWVVMGYVVGFVEGPEPGSMMWRLFHVLGDEGPMGDLIEEAEMSDVAPWVGRYGCSLGSHLYAVKCS